MFLNKMDSLTLDLGSQSMLKVEKGSAFEFVLNLLKKLFVKITQSLTEFLYETSNLATDFFLAKISFVKHSEKTCVFHFCVYLKLIDLK